MRCESKGIIPGGSSFEVMPGHLIPSKEPECGRFGRDVRPSAALSACAVAESTEHGRWGWGPDASDERTEGGEWGWGPASTNNKRRNQHERCS